MHIPPRSQRLHRRVALFSLLALPFACGAPFEQRVVDASPPRDPWMKEVGDLSGDGKPDLVLCGRNGPLVWYENPSWTRRTISTATGSGGTSNDVALADVDRNGSLDVVLANGVWFANPRPGADPRVATWARYQIDATTAHDVVVRDLDRDGDLDVVKRNQGSTGNVIRVFRRESNGAWTERAITVPAGEGLELADLDLDGDPDIVIGGAWYENNGNPISGPWTRYVYTTSYTHPHVVVKVANVGGSSRPDIVLSPAEAAGASYRLSWFEAPTNPKGIWAERILENDLEAVVHGLVLADFDQNGRTDVAFSEMHQGGDPDRVRLRLQGTNGGWSGVVLSSTGSHNLAGGDLDGDGDVDLFGANWSTGAADGAPARIWVNRMGTSGLAGGAVPE